MIEKLLEAGELPGYGELNDIEKLQEIVRLYNDDENVTITGETILLTDLGLNSYALVEMICKIEEEFGIEIPDRKINSFKTIQDVLDYIASQK